MAEVTILIDGREVTVEAGLNLIEAARRLGIMIPHFCYHPGLGVDGNCRMCLVEVEGQPKPAIACNTFARDVITKDGVRQVFTASAKVKEWQRAVLEFLFLNHPLDCPICDQSGECFLQDYYMANGQYQSRLDTPKLHKRKVVDVGPRVKLDAERCVLCTRCVRFCDQVTGTGELAIVNRGNRSEITNYPDIPLANDYSLNTVDLCPVGALTGSEFRFQKRVWLLSSAHSLCTGCARGCNIFLEHAEGLVYRYRPRENMEVNTYWMCDAGRQTFHALNEERLEVPEAEGKEIPFAEALARAESWFREAKGALSLLLLSPASSVETIFAAKRFAADFLGDARVAGGGTRPDGAEDAILRKADPYPNSRGLRLLGIGRDPESELAKGGRLLVIVEDDPLAGGQRPAWKHYLARWERVLYLGANRQVTSRAAGLAFPVTPHSECDGTFVNCHGRLQRFRRAVAPRGDALWVPELLRRIAFSSDPAAEAGGSFGWPSFSALWNDLVAREPAFARVEVAKLGATGQSLIATTDRTVAPAGGDTAAGAAAREA
jgi:NADH-quinone oxidoreductase subunit G